MWRSFLFVLVVFLASSCSRKPAAEASPRGGGDPVKGVEAIRRYGCGACHSIPGVPDARSTIGPPLEGIASRTFLAGQLSNTPENMMRWIQHPRKIDERTIMPDLGIGDTDARNITTYLYTLR